MTPPEFRRLLQKALGRAILFARANDTRPYRDLILCACLHDWAYDSQVEDDRAVYLFDLIHATHEVEFYRAKILKALAERSDDWDEQLYALTGEFAKHGDKEARQVIYDTFARNSLDDFVRTKLLITLDGLVGYIFAADILGGQPLADIEDWKFDHVYGYAEKRFGEQATWSALNQASEGNSRVARYIGWLKDVQARLPARKTGFSKPNVKNITYAEIKASQFKRISLIVWGKSASPADLEQAAQDLKTITDASLLSKYLLIFYRRAFPLNHRLLMDLVFHPDRLVRIRTILALTNIAHSDVHALAIRLIQSNFSDRGLCVELLVRNFEDSDYGNVETLSAEMLGRSGFHRLGLAAIQFYKAHPNSDSEIRLLLRLYEMGPCLNCRFQFVERLLELNALPEPIRAECRWDANLLIRNLVKIGPETNLPVPRPYRGAADFERFKMLLMAGRQANNGTYYPHVGDVQWWLFYPDASANFPQRIWYWESGDALLGCCLLTPAESAFDVFVRPDLRGSAEAEAMERWAEAQLLAQDVKRPKVFWIAESDVVRRRALEERQYDSVPDLNYYVRALQDLPRPQLPLGYSIRATLGEAELEQRALASHAAFRSKWTMDKYLERRLSFMRSPVFVADRDRVVVSPEGRVASFCIYWLDLVNKVGLFEPVGTHPDFQGQGLGKALLYDTLRRMQAEGMHTAIVCAEVNNLAANRLYESVGFIKTNTLLLFQKEM